MSRNSQHFIEPEGSLPHPQANATCPYPEQRNSLSPRLCEMFRNIVSFYGEELLARLPIPKLAYPPLSTFRGFLCNIFAATLHPQLEQAPIRSDRDPLITEKNTNK
jgi:hypothetical protein